LITVSYLNYCAQMDVRVVTALLCVEHEVVTTNEKRSQFVPANERSLLITVSYLNYCAQMDVRVVTALLCVEHEVVGKGEEDREQDGGQGQVEAGPQGSVKNHIKSSMFVKKDKIVTVQHTLIKKITKFSSYIRKFRWDRVQSHI
jgi:hypothetical protein